MKIVIDYPPNIAEIQRVCKPDKYTVYTYGNVLYNPGAWPLSDDLIEHEKVHSKQQGVAPLTWWNIYLDDPKFRFQQELQAYRFQYKFYAKTHNRTQKRLFLKNKAKALSGSIYGKIADFETAKNMIQWGV